MKVIALALAALFTMSFAETYIVPKQYDDTYRSLETKAGVLITNHSPYLSSSSKTVLGESVKVRCEKIDVMPCRVGTAHLELALGGLSLFTSAGESVPKYTHELFGYKSGSKWMVCGDAAGGVTWDTAYMYKSGNKIKLSYTPNDHQKNFKFFTSSVDHGDNSSFMYISVQQVCQ